MAPKPFVVVYRRSFTVNSGNSSSNSDGHERPDSLISCRQIGLGRVKSWCGQWVNATRLVASRDTLCCGPLAETRSPTTGSGKQPAFVLVFLRIFVVGRGGKIKLLFIRPVSGTVAEPIGSGRHRKTIHG